MRFMKSSILPVLLFPYLDFVTVVIYETHRIIACSLSEIWCEKGIQNSAFPMLFVKICLSLLNNR